jgi:uncharacterized protein (TIRG00374 family)
MPAPDQAPDHAAAHHRRVVIGCAKLAVAVGIFAFLYFRLRGEPVFERLLNEPKHWPSLAIALGLVLTALSINYIRWYVLVRALGLEFTLRDSFRLGSLGLLLSQVSFGSIGGDLFKAVFIAREQPGKRTEAVASVLIDRIVGLFAMLLVASAGYAVARQSMEFSPRLHALAQFVVVCAAIGAVGVGLLMTSAFTGPWAKSQAERVPGIAVTLDRLIDAAGAYRHQRRYLFAGILLGCVTHTLFVVAIWFIGRGLPIEEPPLLAVFVVGPMSLATGALPFTPGGLGTFETAMDELYRAAGADPGAGFLVAIAYRAMVYVMAAFGGIYYLRARRTVSAAIHDAEELADEPSGTAAGAS